MPAVNGLSETIKDGIYQQVVALLAEISEKENLMEEFHHKKRKVHHAIEDILADPKVPAANSATNAPLSAIASINALVTTSGPIRGAQNRPVATPVNLSL